MEEVVTFWNANELGSPQARQEDSLIPVPHGLHGLQIIFRSHPDPTPLGTRYVMAAAHFPDQDLWWFITRGASTASKAFKDRSGPWE